MKRLGKYDLLSTLGQGGMGAVYLGRDTILDRDVAIKVIHEQTLHDPTIKKRFYREARSAGRLSHPNITIIYDVGEADDTPFLVMEYLEGEDLKHLLDAGTQFSLADKLDIAAQICRGLHYAHQQGIIHRDIKPPNIRILPNGRVKIMDFGIARIQEETQALTQTNLSLGTPRYMSPEQIQGVDVIDHRSDIFSFGVLFYELLTGTNPFSGDRITTIIYKILSTTPKPIAIAPEALSQELQAIVSKCLEKNRDDRYQDFGAVLGDLAPLAAREAKGTATYRKDETLTVPVRGADGPTVTALHTVDDTLSAPPPEADDTVALTASDDTLVAPRRPTRPARPPSTAPPGPSEKAPSSKGRRLALWIGAALLLLAVGYGIVSLAGDADPSPDPALQAEAVEPDAPQADPADQENAVDPADTRRDAAGVPTASPSGATGRQAASPTQTPTGRAAGTPNTGGETTATPPSVRSERATSPPDTPTRAAQPEATSPQTEQQEPAVPADPGQAEILNLRARAGEGAAAENTALPAAALQALEPAVQQLARDLKANLEAENNNGMRAMMYRGWDAFFQTADAITATVQHEAARVAGSRATVPVSVALTYRDRANQNRQQTTRYTWTLSYMNNDWMLTRVVPQQ